MGLTKPDFLVFVGEDDEGEEEELEGVVREDEAGAGAMAGAAGSATGVSPPGGCSKLPALLKAVAC